MAFTITLLAVFAFASSWPTIANAFYNHRIAPANNQTWQAECGACHFAYQPGLLPTASWDKLLTAQALHDHFGEAVDLEPDTLKEIRNYALTHAADKSFLAQLRKNTKINADPNAPLRVTEEKNIAHAHRRIPAKMIAGNKDVRTLNNCAACHTRANDGIYDAKTVLIPNYRDYWVVR